MCVGPEQSNSSPQAVSQWGVPIPNNNEAASSNSDDGEMISYLLELAANNDITKFKASIEDRQINVLGVGNWYSRRNGSKLMVLEQRTPAMIAALYGSTDVLKYILSLYDSFEDINMACGTDGSTALHCAAAGGSPNAVETVNLLLDFGADINVLDAGGRRPADVIASFPRLKNVKKTLEYLLKAGKCIVDMHIEVPKGIGLSGCSSGDESSHSEDVVDVKDLSISAMSNSSSEVSPSSSPRAGIDKTYVEGNEKVREYPVDPSIPDIKNSIYTTDEFRMFSFKIRPCSRAYSHDWTECPFVHPGENARRRDPRRYHYSCVPCPDFRKGQCRRGDACEYAHGVFECWLHPAQYRTRLCKDGTDCSRRVCFFAHTADELRPLYMSSGSSIPSPRAALDMAAMSPPLAPGSPSSNLMMSSFSLSSSGHSATQVNVGTPPLSPASSAGAWSSSSVPALHLPGMNLQGSRLRSALSARDIPLDDLGRMSEYDGQHVAEFSPLPAQTLSTQARLNAAVAASACGSVSSRSGKYRSLGLNVAPTNLDELFASEMSSPRSMMHGSVLMSPGEKYMKSSQMQVNSQTFSPIPDQVQLQMQPTALDSPRLYASPQTQPMLESQLQGSPRIYSSPSTPSSYSLGSLGRMSTLGQLDIERQSCEISLPPAVVAARAAFGQRDKRSHSSRDLGAGSTWADWGSPNGKAEWSIQRDDLSRFRKSASFGIRGSDEPDLTWVQTLVKEGPQDGDVTPVLCSEDGSGGDPRESTDCSALGSWMENLHLDQIVA